MIRVLCKNTQTKKTFPEGTSLLEMLYSFDFPQPSPILCAKVNNVPEGLKFRAYHSMTIEYLDYSDYSGRNVYSRSLCFLLVKAAKDLLPGAKVVVRRPISKGFYCVLEKNDGTEVTQEEVELLRAHMKTLVEKDLPFYRHEAEAEEVFEIFRGLGYEDKIKLLQTTGEVYITYYTLEDSADYYYDAVVPSTGYLKVWCLEKFQEGMLLRIPDRHSPDRLAYYEHQPKTFDVFKESLRWNTIMGLRNVGDVNYACQNGRGTELIQVSEALQEKKIVQIAEEIDRRFRSEQPIKLVLITGPSSSGKTTFCNRLAIQLKACGLKPEFFSTDDYFVNRLDTPRFPDGSFDFDNFDTVDHDYLQQDVLKLLSGEAVEVPQFNFVTGLREYNGKTLQLTEGSILLIEGIHALNPALTNLVDEKLKFRIFINTITSISLDDHNCIPTSDNRLLRRIIRDYNSGAFTPMETITQWPNVRRAEVKWIYPYQESADVLFNSAYLVEFAVIRNHAEQVLSMVPKNCPQYSEAHRLLQFLHYFTPVPDKEIPRTSMMREFVGNTD